MPDNQRFTIHWLHLALQDMQECAEYIAQDDPETARLVVDRIWQEGQSLCLLSNRGRPGRVPGTRELVLQGLPYFLAYRVRGKTVQILRVIHTARQWPQSSNHGKRVSPLPKMWGQYARSMLCTPNLS